MESQTSKALQFPGVPNLMCDVRKTAIRVLMMGLAAGLLAGDPQPGHSPEEQALQAPQRARRETNAAGRRVPAHDRGYIHAPL